MALPSYSESREQNTILATTAAAVAPRIINNAINSHAGVSMFFGKLSEDMFGPIALNGKAKRMSAGESIEVRVQLAKNDTAKMMSSGYETFDTDTQDTARVLRANWKLGGGTAVISGYERRNNSGMERIADLLQYKLTEAAQSVVDLVAEKMYAGGTSADVTGLDAIIAAGTTSLQGIAGSSYPNWNSRGISAKGTAAGSISFTGGSFATTGLTNWRYAYMNASEGAIQPEFILTTEDIWRYYEGTLSPQVRYSDLRVGDGAFKTLQFNGKPVFHDSYATSGVSYFINTDYLYAVCAPGADFQLTPLASETDQDVWSSKVLFQGNFVTEARKFNNKVISQTA